MKRFQLLLLFSGFFISALSQDMQWSASLKLSWSDFKAVPDESNPFFAVTHAGFGYKYNADQDSIHVSTFTNFKSAQSWVKKPSAHLLLHEQLHFDIAEYFRRVFVERLSKATLAFGNAKRLIPQVYAETLVELRAEQARYDEESNHSINKDEQQKWKLKYEIRLKESFERTNFSIQFTR